MSFPLKKTSITCDTYNINIYNQETISIAVKITDYNNNPLPNEEFTLYIDDKAKTTPSTNADGTNTITYTLTNDLNNIGVHTIRVNETIIRFNAYLDSGWNQVTYKSGFSKYSNDSTGTQYRVYNHTVEIRGQSTNTTVYSGDEVTFATIPSEYAPPIHAVFELMQGSDANKWLLAVKQNGDLSIQRYGTTSSLTNVATTRWLQTYLIYTI